MVVDEIRQRGGPRFLPEAVATGLAPDGGLYLPEFYLQLVISWMTGMVLDTANY